MTNPVDDLRRQYRVWTDAALAARMNVTRSAVAKWRQRGTIPLTRLAPPAPPPPPPGRPTLLVENVVWTDMRRAKVLLDTAQDLAVEHDLPALHILRASKALQSALLIEAKLHPADPGAFK